MAGSLPLSSHLCKVLTHTPTIGCSLGEVCNSQNTIVSDLTPIVPSCLHNQQLGQTLPIHPSGERKNVWMFPIPSLLPSFTPSLLPSFPPSLLHSYSTLREATSCLREATSCLHSFPPSLLPSFPPSLRAGKPRPYSYDY